MSVEDQERAITQKYEKLALNIIQEEYQRLRDGRPLIDDDKYIH